NNNANEDNTGLYNGVLINNPTFVEGYVGNAVYLNSSPSLGQEQWIEIPFVNLSYQSFTIEMWIKSTGSYETDYRIFVECESLRKYHCLHFIIYNKRIHFGFYSDDTQGKTELLPNTWYHVALVYNSVAAQRLIYLNGIQDEISVKSVRVGPYKGQSGSLSIPSCGILSDDHPSKYFQGYIDQFSITIDRAKSPCEILNDATLVKKFDFDDTFSNSNSNIKFNNIKATVGRVNQGISFDSPDAYFQAGGFLALGLRDSPFSFSLWIKPTTNDGGGTILHVSACANGANSGDESSCKGKHTCCCTPFIGFSSNKSIVAQIHTNSHHIVGVFGPILVANTWTHIAQTF
ncbi:unnamed protein product, partial [Didymodactylos carnosus]